MNTCVLMAQIVSKPQLRTTQDTQNQMVEMWVQFPGLGTDDPPPATMRVIGWGKYLGNMIHDNYSEGDRVILQGRLSMNTFDRQEGFKEKKAELVVSHIYPLGSSDLSMPSSPQLSTSQPPDNVVSINKAAATPQHDDPPIENTLTEERVTETPTVTVNTQRNLQDNKNLDDIPF